MKTLLAAAAMVLAASTANAAIVGDLGVNPDSAQGAFSTNDSVISMLPTGLFSQQWTFQLIGGPAFITIASVINVFPGGQSGINFIEDFTGSVWDYGDNGIFEAGGGDDNAVISPVLATIGCGSITNCQSLAGEAILAAGNYYAQFTGNAHSNAGYGGNIAVSAVPIPAALPLFASAMGALGLLRWRRNRRV